jgi:hypothetical protein
MRQILIGVISFLVITYCSLPISAEIIRGIEFPDGPRSFADAVYSYSPGGDVDLNGTYADP